MTESRPLRVSMLATSYPMFRGDFSGQFVHKLARALVERGCHTSVIAPHHAGSLEREEIDDVSVTRFRYGPSSLEKVAFGDGIAENLRSSWRARLALPFFLLTIRRASRKAERDADVLHVHWAPPAALIARPRIPLVVTVHGSDLLLAQRGKFWERLLRIATGRAAKVVTVSQKMAKMLRPYVDDPDKIEITATGVDRGLAMRRTDPPTRQVEPRIVFVGRVLESKGVVDLARAFVMTPPGTKLDIVGKGPAEAAVRSVLSDACREEDVTFHGALPNEQALNIMAAGDIFCIPSYFEGVPVVALEATALGRPLVGTPVGILPELAGDLDLTVEIGDVEALAERLLCLLDDPPFRHSIGDELRRRVLERYTWDRLAENTETLYRAAIERERTGA